MEMPVNCRSVSTKLYMVLEWCMDVHLVWFGVVAIY